MSNPKVTHDIETLLQWAYCEELPKQDLAVECSNFRDVQDYGDRGGVDVSWSIHPQRYANIGPPHPDALQLEYLVRGLEAQQIVWPAARDILLPDLKAYLPDNAPELVAVRQIREHPAGLVAMHARLRTRPIWEVGPVTVNRIIGKNGKPVVNGITDGRRYGDGAHCPLQLDPEPAEIVSARFEYLCWHTALVNIARESWNLASFAPQRPRAAQAPWLTGPERKPRILPTIAPTKKVLHRRDHVNV